MQNHQELNWKTCTTIHRAEGNQDITSQYMNKKKINQKLGSSLENTKLTWMTPMSNYFGNHRLRLSIPIKTILSDWKPLIWLWRVQKQFLRCTVTYNSELYHKNTCGGLQIYWKWSPSEMFSWDGLNFFWIAVLRKAATVEPKWQNKNKNNRANQN